MWGSNGIGQLACSVALARARMPPGQAGVARRGGVARRFAHMVGTTFQIQLFMDVDINCGDAPASDLDLRIGQR